MQIANYDLANLSYSPCYYTRRTTTILLRVVNHSATSIIIFKKINGLLSAPKLEHWVGVEPTNVGFADQPPADEDPLHKRWWGWRELNPQNHGSKPRTYANSITAPYGSPGGIRTHTVLLLRQAPPANWATGPYYLIAFRHK